MPKPRAILAHCLAPCLALSLAMPVMAQQDLRARADQLLDVLPDTPPEAAQGTAEQVALGKRLYIDPRLSRSQAISCNSCHNLGLGGVDLQQTSIGHGWVFGGRNAPTSFNAVFHLSQFWDGRAADLQAQAGGPMANPVEMGNTHGAVVDTLSAIPGYRELFARAYPEVAEPLTLDNATHAIAAFEATLITPDSRFDRWLEGDDAALDDTQKEGLALYLDSGCTACHSGALFGGDSYQKFGAVALPSEEVLPRDDTGRMKVTGNESDRYVFKVPSLRNIALTRPYFHSGAVWELERAVQIMAESQLGMSLSDDDAGKIAAFLESLTGKQPEVGYPVLPASTDDTPQPDPEADMAAEPVGH